MALLKFGAAQQITEVLENAPESLSDAEIHAQLQSHASTLKRVAPRANDFLYFSAVMMHAAEASLVNEDGTPKFASNGERVRAHWEKKGESVRWICNDPFIRPYRNSNGDIFPEEELLKAYKKWVGRPLCIDHKSSSVDFIRGIILDTYYDRVGKRVIALCALDKLNFPDLARKVSSGYATCVSMGTAVGKAVCADCGTVARTEHDFCNHMRTKSGYGEINLDLQPIELSIVVNGADPQAKIRHILASANLLNQYADVKEQELRSLAASENKDKVNEIKDKIVHDIKEGLESLIKEFEGSDKNSAAEETADKAEANAPGEAPSDELQKAASSAETVENNDSTLANAEKSEDNEALHQKFMELKAEIQQKLAKIEEDLGSRDNTMVEKKAYFQGAGGVNEPTPGQPKYEKEDSDSIREKDDKQMAPSSLGGSDGLAPGDLERKKLLARAEIEERAERRKSAVMAAKEKLQSKAYYHGTEEPTPGKTKYAPEPVKGEKDDKQLQGQSPFPGVGKVDGLHPSPESADVKDELKRKEMLSRASLKAKFVKGATSQGDLDRAKSQWQVFANDKLVFAATVDEISAGRADVLYDVIATRDFGTKMLERVKEVGFEKAAELYKKADDATPPPAAMPDAAAPAAPAAPAPALAPEAPAADPTASADRDGDGDPKRNIELLANDIIEEVKHLDSVADALTEEAPEAPSADMPAVTASMQQMRVELNAALLSEVKKASAELAEHKEELELVQHLYDTNSVDDTNRDYVEALAADTISETRVALANSKEILTAFVNYARGTEAMMKRAETEETMVKNAMDLDDTKPMLEDPATLPMLDEELDAIFEEELARASEEEGASDDGETEEAADENAAASLELTPETLAKLPADMEVKMAEFDLSTREGRTAYRAKLAAEAKFSPVLNESKKHVEQKADGDLGKVETLEETHSKMMDVAQAPAKIRKDAEELVKLVKAGKLAADEVDGLVSHGLDPEAAKYFKELWKEVEGGGEFAAELVKEHAKAKMDEEIKSYKVKLARAYDLAYQMADRGLCGRDHSVITAQVEEILGYNDEAFDSLKRVVARHAPVALKKEAARIPHVGLLGTEEPAGEPEDLLSGLTRAFSGRRY